MYPTWYFKLLIFNSTRKCHTDLIILVYYAILWLRNSWIDSIAILIKFVFVFKVFSLFLHFLFQSYHIRCCAYFFMFSYFYYCGICGCFNCVIYFFFIFKFVIFIDIVVKLKLVIIFFLCLIFCYRWWRILKIIHIFPFSFNHRSTWIDLCINLLIKNSWLNIKCLWA